MPWTDTFDHADWKAPSTHAAIILVRRGKLKGVWTAMPFGAHLPARVRRAVEMWAGRRAASWHTRHDPTGPSPNYDLPPVRHSPSQLHWNQLLMLVVADRAEVLG